MRDMNTSFSDSLHHLSASMVADVPSFNVNNNLLEGLSTENRLRAVPFEESTDTAASTGKLSPPSSYLSSLDGGANSFAGFDYRNRIIGGSGPQGQQAQKDSNVEKLHEDEDSGAIFRMEAHEPGVVHPPNISVGMFLGPPAPIQQQPLCLF